MDKMKLAHDWFISAVNNGKHVTIEQAWCYADAMQAEADKRNKAEAAQKRKEIREMLNAVNTFVEREGQHFDDVEEWQPDWSQAPEWANWWAIDLDENQAHWYEVEPAVDVITWHRRTRACKQAPSFSYQGDWRESLRRRPQ